MLDTIRFRVAGPTGQMEVHLLRVPRSCGRASSQGDEEHANHVVTLCRMNMPGHFKRLSASPVPISPLSCPFHSFTSLQFSHEPGLFSTVQLSGSRLHRRPINPTLALCSMIEVCVTTKSTCWNQHGPGIVQQILFRCVWVFVCSERVATASPHKVNFEHPSVRVSPYLTGYLSQRLFMWIGRDEINCRGACYRR